MHHVIQYHQKDVLGNRTCKGRLKRLSSASPKKKPEAGLSEK